MTGQALCSKPWVVTEKAVQLPWERLRPPAVLTPEDANRSEQGQGDEGPPCDCSLRRSQQSPGLASLGGAKVSGQLPLPARLPHGPPA